MKNGLIIISDRCMGCHTCFTACKEENQLAPGVKWNHLERVEHEKAGVIDYFRVSCMHCEDPACMKVCPVKAIHKGPRGEVLVDQSKCIGCHMCEQACPYHAPKFSDPAKQSYFGDKKSLSTAGPRPENVRTPGKAEHCTLCAHRTEKGLLPACAAACPAGPSCTSTMKSRRRKWPSSSSALRRSTKPPARTRRSASSRRTRTSASSP